MGFFSSSESSFGTSIKSFAGPSPVKPNIGDPIRVTLFIRRFCEWAINPERKPPKDNSKNTSEETASNKKKDKTGENERVTLAQMKADREKLFQQTHMPFENYNADSNSDKKK